MVAIGTIWFGRHACWYFGSRRDVLWLGGSSFLFSSPIGTKLHRNA